MSSTMFDGLLRGYVLIKIDRELFVATYRTTFSLVASQGNKKDTFAKFNLQADDVVPFITQ